MIQAIFGTTITSTILNSIYRIASIVYVCKTNNVGIVNPVGDQTMNKINL